MSASLLQAPDTVAISGGQFNSTLGHHVTINLNQVASEGSISERSVKATLAPTPPRDSFPGPSNSSSAPEANISSTSTGISVCVETNLRNHLDVPPQKSNEIYERHLWLKGRGFPLWIPEPNRRLSRAYRKKGVNIGDVGIITPSGGFSFLFNICVPSDNPINPRLLPEGFAPIYPPLDVLDVIEFEEFKSGSYLASSSIENSQSGSDARGLVFETSASEGAILTMPEGAVAYDLENIPAFRDYVAANVEKWYKFVNGVRGREAKNGDVRLVIGCDKTTSWGMAALANVTQHKVSQLKFKATEDSRVKPSRPLYTWDYSGMAEVKVGPDAKEVNALRSDDPLDATPPSDEEFCNQCLFIRTLNATLNDEEWKALNDNLGSTNVIDSSSSSRTIFPETPPRSQKGTRGTPSNVSQSHSSIGTQRTDTQLEEEVESIFLRGESDTLWIDQLDVPTLPSRLPHPNIESEGHEGRGQISTTPCAIVNHPSDGLNKLLLKKFPECKMVVTEDSHWYAMVKEDDDNLPGPESLLDRVLSIYDIQVTNGILFLEGNPEKPPKNSNSTHKGSKPRATVKQSSSQAAHLKGRSLTSGIVASRVTAPRRKTQPPPSVNAAEDDDGDSSSVCGSSDGLDSLWDNAITSEGGFTDYLTEVSEAELQRQAEDRAALLALTQAEELEFELARQKLRNVPLQPPKSWNPTPNNAATKAQPLPANIRK